MGRPKKPENMSLPELISETVRLTEKGLADVTSLEEQVKKATAYVLKHNLKLIKAAKRKALKRKKK